MIATAKKRGCREDPATERAEAAAEAAEEIKEGVEANAEKVDIHQHP